MDLASLRSSSVLASSRLVGRMVVRGWGTTMLLSAGGSRRRIRTPSRAGRRTRAMRGSRGLRDLLNLKRRCEFLTTREKESWWSKSASSSGWNLPHLSSDSRRSSSTFARKQNAQVAKSIPNPSHVESCVASSAAPCVQDGRGRERSKVPRLRLGPGRQFAVVWRVFLCFPLGFFSGTRALLKRFGRAAAVVRGVRKACDQTLRTARSGSTPSLDSGSLPHLCSPLRPGKPESSTATLTQATSPLPPFEAPPAAPPAPIHPFSSSRLSHSFDSSRSSTPASSESTDAFSGEIGSRVELESPVGAGSICREETAATRRGGGVGARRALPQLKEPAEALEETLLATRNRTGTQADVLALRPRNSIISSRKVRLCGRARGEARTAGANEDSVQISIH